MHLIVLLSCVIKFLQIHFFKVFNWFHNGNHIIWSHNNILVFCENNPWGKSYIHPIILFLTFFNDITTTCLENRISTALYADDVALWVASSSLALIQLRLQKRIREVEDWMSKWRCKISVKKTVYTVFNKAGLNEKLTLEYNGENIDRERNFKFLGHTQTCLQAS
jgi:hypothetical protein